MRRTSLIAVAAVMLVSCGSDAAAEVDEARTHEAVAGAELRLESGSFGRGGAEDELLTEMALLSRQLADSSELGSRLDVVEIARAWTPDADATSPAWSEFLDGFEDQRSGLDDTTAADTTVLAIALAMAYDDGLAEDIEAELSAGWTIADIESWLRTTSAAAVQVGAIRTLIGSAAELFED